MAILGVGGDEVVQDIPDVMSAKRSYTAISRTVHIHPTVNDFAPTMLQDLRPLDYRGLMPNCFVVRPNASR